MCRKRLLHSLLPAVVLNDRRRGRDLLGDEETLRRSPRGCLGEKDAPTRGRTGASAAVRNDPRKYRSHETKVG